MVGIAQERTSAWRGWRDGGPDGHPHFVYRRQSIFPNNYYIYIRDPDWGPTFIKTIAYAPFPVWVYLNGNEWACDTRSHATREHARLEVRLMS
jgi:hypothetical protein